MSRLVVGLRLELARRRGFDRGGEGLGAPLHLQVHVDLEQGQGRQLAHRLGAGLAHQHLERALEAQLGVGRGGDREPEVEVVGAQVVVGDAGVRVDDLRGALRVLGVDLGRDQHRLVAERAGVEDRRDLADDPLVEQALGAGHHLVERAAPASAATERERLAGRAGSSTAAGSSAACRSSSSGIAAPSLRERSFGWRGTFAHRA